jgi:hypothetical protein
MAKTIPTPITTGYYKDLLVEGTQEQIEAVLARTDQLFQELAVNLPWSPIDALDSLIRFGTGLLGYAVTLPFAGQERILRERLLPYTKSRHKLATATQMMAVPQRTFSSFTRQITLTSENGILAYAVTTAARFVWVAIKRLRLIRSLMGIRSELQLIEFLIDYAIKKVRRLGAIARFAGMTMGLLAILAAIASNISYLGILSMVWEGEWDDQFLPQDSQRIYGRRPGQHRVNLRKGKDK